LEGGKILRKRNEEKINKYRKRFKKIIVTNLEICKYFFGEFGDQDETISLKIRHNKIVCKD
jgi:hypothetical protein